MRIKVLAAIGSTLLCIQAVAVAQTPEAISPLPSPPPLASPPPSPIPATTIPATTIPTTAEPSIPTATLTPQPIAHWVLAIGTLIGALAIGFGVSRYSRNSNWSRIEFLRKAVQEFEQDPDIWKALKILDFEEYRDYEILYRNQKITFQVDNEVLCDALASHEIRKARKEEINDLQAKGRLSDKVLENYQIETAIRDWFNKMLNGLEHFGYFVESGMFTANEIRPWMIYWIRLIADRKYKRPDASKFYDQLYSYIHSYGFSGVINLFERFGYRILPTPYQDNDFTDLDRSDFQINQFHLQTALSLAKAAYLIYQDDDYVREIAKRWKIYDTDNDFKFFNDPVLDTQAFMFKTKHFIVIAFRGSQEIKDWQTNFRTQMKTIPITTKLESWHQDNCFPPPGFVHRGFQTAWETIDDPVRGQIRRWNQAEKRDLPLLLTGHSLGGALATVAAASLVYRGFKVEGLYTFGQPRVGDLKFARSMNMHDNLKGKIIRFVNNNDIVPRIPPPFLPWNFLHCYCHIGQMIYFDSRGNLIRYPNPIARFIDFLIGLARDAFEPGFDMVNDHRMEFYISNLKKALEIEQAQANLLEEEKKQNAAEIQPRKIDRR